MESQDVVDLIKGKFNWDNMQILIDRARELKPDLQLFQLAEGVYWHEDEHAIIMSPERAKELRDTGDVDIVWDKEDDSGKENK